MTKAIILKIGQTVIDREQNEGIVVSITLPCEEKINGEILVYQLNKEDFNSNNCISYKYVSWQNSLSVLKDKSSSKEINIGDKLNNNVFFGVVVEIYEGVNELEDGCIKLWLENKTYYGSDNCAYFSHYNWNKFLTKYEN